MPWIPLAPALGILGLLMAFGIYRYVVAQPAGSGLMIEISDSIQTGAMAFLRKEYTILAWFIVVVAILLTVGIGKFTALAFVSGAICSMLAGFIGMKAATKANVGTALVGKVEAGIPEDDPRNPAVIADNVGDNVGDVAGMGADLFESYV